MKTKTYKETKITKDYTIEDINGLDDLRELWENNLLTTDHMKAQNIRLEDSDFIRIDKKIDKKGYYRMIGLLHEWKEKTLYLINEKTYILFDERHKINIIKYLIEKGFKFDIIDSEELWADLRDTQPTKINIFETFTTYERTEE